MNVVFWKWKPRDGYTALRVPYEAKAVNVATAMVRRNYRGDVRVICVTDDPAGVECETFPLWSDCETLQNASGANLPSCYRRLKLFDPATQREMGIAEGERIVSIDLDTVITGELNPLFDRPDRFVGWAVEGTYHPRVFNGSMWMLRAGSHPEVWTTFNPATSPRKAAIAGYRGSDQAWISYRLRHCAGWEAGDGVYSYHKDVRGRSLPESARVVMFHGKLKPWMPAALAIDWVREHYRDAA